MRALGRYVETRRYALPDSTIRWASNAAGISAKKWIDIEKGRGPHAKTTLRKVARALGESPRHILTMAGLDYDDDTVEPPPDLIAQIERHVMALLDEVRSLRLPPEAGPGPESPGT